MRLFFGLLVVGLVVSCQRKSGEYEMISEPLTEEQAREAQQLMATHCYLCHSPNAPELEGRIAPPMVGIKGHYLQAYPERADFIKGMVDFVNHPTLDKTLMPGAVKRFGVMPYQDYPKGVAEKIAAYLYDYQIEEPDWFASHWESNQGPWKQIGKILPEVITPKTHKELGLDYALGTKAILGKNLMGAIQAHGTLAALEFCNERAIPLTDSMSVHYHANIKRVSDKPRNPNNAANAEELKYIEQFKQVIASKSEPQPVVLEREGRVQFYYPITTNSMCLQCHGKQVSPEVRQQTLKLYPKDLAVGYEENEVRGIWSISFLVSR
jgi:hypothetical protein